MSHRPNYVKGDWLTICDRCGRVYHGSQLKKEWDGFMVCKDCWEPRQPQDFVRGIVDTQIPPYVRPETTDIFVVETLCDVEGSTAIPGIAIPGCSIPSTLLPVWYMTVPKSTFTV
jgi:hypothetical protein